MVDRNSEYNNKVVDDIIIPNCLLLPSPVQGLSIS